MNPMVKTSLLHGRRVSIPWSVMTRGRLVGGGELDEAAYFAQGTKFMDTNQLEQKLLNS